MKLKTPKKFMVEKNIVTIGGGTGSFMVLSGIKKYPHKITAIVSTVDDGGSTGRLRDELGVLPPGDARQCLVALSKESLALRRFLNYRFESGELKGHTLGNLIISALEKMRGSFSDGIKEAQKIFDIEGNIMPSGCGESKLIMRMKNGRKLIGENKIYKSEEIKKENIEDIFLSPKGRANANAVEKIKKADLLVICPGNIYCSLLPNLLIEDISEAIKKSEAKVVYVCNLVNKLGQTDNFDLDDYAGMLNSRIGGNRIDYVLYNTRKPDEKAIERYKQEGEFLVDFRENKKSKRSYRVVKADLLSDRLAKKASGGLNSDELASRRSFIRHDSSKLAIVIDYIARMEELGGIIEEIR
ncbi:MAG: uridine diphosphate-N-acetylglucosamine-binding protein YvcK [Candidatus Moraniibacteriota bacterium]